MDLRVLKNNALIYSLGTLGLRATSFLLIPLYTHLLTVSDFGALATLLAIIQVMIMLMSLGVREGFVRFASEFENQNRIGFLLGSSLMINLCGAVLVTCFSLSFLLPLFRSILHSDNIQELILLTCLAAAAQSLCMLVMSYYRARNEGLKFMSAGLSTALLMLIANVFFIYGLGMGISGALLAQVTAYGILFLLLSGLIFSKTGIGITFQIIGSVGRFSFPLVFSMGGGLLFEAGALALLGYFCTLEDVAIFSLGFKLSTIAGILYILPFQLAYSPFVYANVGKPELPNTISKLLTYLVLGFSFVAFGIVVISRDFLPLIAPPEYSSAYYILFLILPGVLFRGCLDIGSSLLNIRYKSHLTGITVSIFTIVGLALNYLCINLMGIYGAVLVFNLYAMATAIALLVIGMKHFPIPIESARLSIAAALFTLFLVLVFFLGDAGRHWHYGLPPVVALASIALLYFGNFFDPKEKSAIKDALATFQRSFKKVAERWA